MVTRKFILSVLFSLICFSSLYVQAHAHTCSAVAKRGTVALTFDDGPSTIYTTKVLAILEKYRIKATFFVVGRNARLRPKLLKKMIADGDIIGNHSFSHPKIPHLTGENLYKEIERPEEIVNKITGIKPKLFRFPYGAENKRVIAFVKSQGLTPVFWGYTPQDFKRPGSKAIAQGVIDHAYSGEVILLHDGPTKRQQTVDALPKIIQGIRNKGLGFSVLCT